MQLEFKTIEEIKSAFLDFDVAEQPTFKKYDDNGTYTIYRMWYKEDTYNWRRDSYKVKDMVYWLLVSNKTNAVFTHKDSLKRARIWLGVPTKKTVVKREIRCKDTKVWDNQICVDGSASGDKAWCGIRSVANITHVTYAEARDLCKAYGWTKRGMFNHQIKKLFKEEGYTVEEKTESVREHAKTIKMFERHGFEGKWLIHVNGHFVSSVNGVVTDWSAARNLRIINAWQISK